MALEDLPTKQSRVSLWFNLAASLLVVGVGGFLVYASYSGWFGARGSRMNLLAWVVVAYGVLRFFLYLRRKRPPEV